MSILKMINIVLNNLLHIFNVKISKGILVTDLTCNSCHLKKKGSCEKTCCLELSLTSLTHFFQYKFLSLMFN